MGLYNLLENTSKVHPYKMAVVCGRWSFTYLQFKSRVDNIAGSFRAAGITKGDRIAIIHQNCHVFLESYFAAAKIGAVLVPINYRLSPRDFVYILKDSQAKMLLIQSEFYNPVDRDKYDVPLIKVVVEGRIEGKHGARDTEPEVLIEGADIAHLYYTSGTTGHPKGVILTHGNNLEHARTSAREFCLTPEDNWLHVSPMFHLADAWAVWAITLAAGTHVMIPCFESHAVFRSIQDHRVTLSNFIPTMLNVLVNTPGVQDYDFSSLRLILSGGAPIAGNIVRKVMKIFGCDYMQTYGMTETSPFLTISKLSDDMAALSFEEKLQYKSKTGRPFSGIQLKIVKEDAQEVLPNERDVGEILVKGKTVTPGYWKLPEETAKRIHNGWLHTRDLAVVDPRGFITIVDRMDDQILTGGESVYSIEVENVLYSHPAVHEVAVFGLPDPLWGEVVTAAVVKKEESLDENDVIRYCKETLAEFKSPKKVFFVDHLPKTGSSKIHKYKLREKFSKK
ncbi:MAG: long-chain-fatty-acid--CoA ligase [Candidatus Aminicenantes bacterium]|nr:long-chain-fatty-acid--CoA ligase [Candidatus Aminicenantes bacterium]